jgi:hypothetical protein
MSPIGNVWCRDAGGREGVSSVVSRALLWSPVVAWPLPPGSLLCFPVVSCGLLWSPMAPRWDPLSPATVVWDIRSSGIVFTFQQLTPGEPKRRQAGWPTGQHASRPSDRQTGRQAHMHLVRLLHRVRAAAPLNPTSRHWATHDAPFTTHHY